MKPRFAPCQWVWLLLFSFPLLRVVAQSALPLTLQPHKIKQAQQLYRDGVAKKNPALIAEAYYVYGRAYYLVGDYAAAHRWFMKSLRIEEKQGDSYELGRVYIRLCNNEMAQYHYHESMRYVCKALSIFSRIDSHKGLLRAYSLLGDIHSTNWPSDGGKTIIARRPDSMLHYYRKFESLALKLNDSLEIAYITGALGGSMVARNDTQGITYLQASLAIYTRKKIDVHRMYITLELVRAYLKFGKLKPARRLLEQAQQLYVDSHLNEYIVRKSLESAWISYHQMIGDWKQAFTRQQKLQALENRVAAADRKGAITRLNLEYETEKKELLLKTQKQELALRSASLLNQQRFIWTMSALLVVTVGMSLIFFRLYRQNQRISAYNAELVNEQSHRVRNNLQVVSDLLSLQANRLPDQTARHVVGESQLRVQATATLHRLLYDSPELSRVSLPEFVRELVREGLEAFGYAHIEPIYELQPISLSADQALPLGLILNELTTNACKYAFPAHDEPVFQVACHQQRKTIRLSVCDNGPGYTPAADTDLGRVPTFGLRLIRMQAEKLGGRYGFSSAGGTRFTLAFNV